MSPEQIRAAGAAAAAGAPALTEAQIARLRLLLAPSRTPETTGRRRRATGATKAPKPGTGPATAA